jgi:RimJ/RimL family protein N-acetyltransferase
MAAKGPETLAPIPDGIADAAVRLRAWREDVVELLRAGAEDEHVALIEHLPVPFSEPGARAWLEDWAVPGRRRPPRGEGVATLGVALLARRAPTGETGVHRLHALVEPWNEASQRVVEKNGFARDGLLRAYSTYRGEHRDDLIHALLRSDLP